MHLTPERVPRREDVGESEMLAVEHDHSGAGTEDRAAEVAQRLVEAVEPHEPCDRCRLAPGDDQAVEAVELLRQAHLDRLRAEAPQDSRVLAKIALYGQDTDAQRLFHRADCRGG